MGIFKKDDTVYTITVRYHTDNPMPDGSTSRTWDDFEIYNVSRRELKKFRKEFLKATGSVYPVGLTLCDKRGTIIAMSGHRLESFTYRKVGNEKDNP